MKTRKYIVAALVAALSLSACEKWLDTQNYTASNTANFPATFEEAEMMVTAIYSNLNHMTSRPDGTFFMVSELASDDRFGGGSGSGGSNKAIDHLMVDNETVFDFSWEHYYKGVYLANSALEGLKLMEGSASDKEYYNQLLGESHFMRALYYFELASIFENVPLIIATTQDSNSPQASVEDLYGQIASDLKQGIDLMSDKAYSAYVSAGHATRWAAEALMARVFLFYTGFYGKDSLPLPDGGAVSKSEVIAVMTWWVITATCGPIPTNTR